LLGVPHFEAMRHEITHPLLVEVDEIYNLACPASPIHYQFDPVQTTKTSVIGAINMLGLAKRLKAKIFQASTSEVYGDPTLHPQPEAYRGNVNPIGPRACYDEGKRCAETLFFDDFHQHHLKIKVARIFDTYGPRMHRSGASGRRDVEFDLSLAPASAGGGEWLRAGGGGTGWRGCHCTGSVGDRDRIRGQRPCQDAGFGRRQCSGRSRPADFEALRARKTKDRRDVH
jgi:nucleoside-diphosphate-sugar epimerase